MNKLAYSLHLSNDKNKTKKARQLAKTNPSKSTSFNNNAIQNEKILSKVNNHNLRKYDNQQELIRIIKGTNNLVKDTKDLYLELFESARIKYNEKQTRSDRKIVNYFEQISNDTLHDLACEVIIELGDMNFWKDKSEEDRLKMINVFIEQTKDLEIIVPNFKVANAVIHFDESSPHLHIVGVPFKDGNINGLEVKVGKSSIFTKDSLKVIQDEMRKLCIKSYNKEYGLTQELKEKKKGRNQDYKVLQMEHYDELCNSYNKQSEQLNNINKDTNKLNKKSKEVKDIITNLKQVPLNKNNSILSNENKEVILDYIKEVDKSSKKVKEINDFSISIDKVKNDLENNYDKLEELETLVYKKDLEITKLNTSIKKKDKIMNEQRKQINDLYKENSKLQDAIDYWVGRFKKFVSFLFGKIHHWYEKDDKYYDVIDDMVKDEVLDEDDIEELAIDQSYDDEREI